VIYSGGIVANFFQKQCKGLLIGIVLVATSGKCENGSDIMNLKIFKPGAIQPQGWIREQLKLDLQKGLTGGYPQLSDNVSQNLFAAQERIPGCRVTGNRGIEEKSWWAGEHEGYWADAVIRSAILTDDKEWLTWAREWVEQILNKFAETGCITIYSPESRFPDTGYDGELWTQSRAFQALLAWYEYSGDRRVVAAVEESVHKTIDHYRKTTYFGRSNPDGGVTHGVGYMDTLEWLYRLTGSPYYAEAMVWLYEDYCKAGFESFRDMCPEELCDAARRWDYHTPHVAESLHMPALAAVFSGRSDYQEAADHVLSKLKFHTNPGGGFVAGDVLESICQTPGGGDVAGEFCSVTEGVQTLNRLFLYQPDFRVPKWIEKAALNAGQGARIHPANKAVIYLSKDNRLRADDPMLQGGRELYSASHKAAACCSLNAMRLLPYYVEAMWLKTDKGLLANLYGPSVLKTEVNGVAVAIEQQTDYPFSDRICFVVSPEAPVTFELQLRIPQGCGNVTVNGNPVDVEELLRIKQEWTAGDEISVDFDFRVIRRIPQDGTGSYLQWGPLVFALPIADELSVHEEIASNRGEPSGFYEYLLTPKSESGWSYHIAPDACFEVVGLPDGSCLTPWSKPPIGLKGQLQSAGGEPVEVTLLPLGATMLRRTTFLAPGETNQKSHEMYQGSGGEKDPMRFF
jgi:hypothetical protein